MRAQREEDCTTRERRGQPVPNRQHGFWIGNVVVLLHRSRSRSISIHGGKYLLARREDSSASYKFCSGRISLYFYKVVNGCIGSSPWCKKNNLIRIISV